MVSGFPSVGIQASGASTLNLWVKSAVYREGVTCLLRTRLSSVDRAFFPDFDGP
jgi:hypothetical protein